MESGLWMEEEHEYFETNDPKVRAGVVAHAIRIGKAPSIGEWLGFALQLKEAEAPNIATAVDHIVQATNTSEKVWCCMTVTAEDLEAGSRLVRSEEFIGRPGKHSYFRT
jgi:hypothetical protein